MINPTRIAVSMTVLAVFLSGCSMFGNNEPEYLASVEQEPLTIPAGLDAPSSPQQVLISVPKVRMPAGDELEPAPPRVVATAGRKDTKTYMAWSARGVYLMVKDSPDIVTQRLQDVIEGSGTTMTMLQRDSQGAHKFHYTQPQTLEEGFFSNMAFWRNKPLDYSGVFMTRLEADGPNTRVHLLFGNGETMDTPGAEHVLSIFMDKLG